MRSHNILSVKKNKKTMASGPTRKALRSWCADRTSVSSVLRRPWVGGRVAVDERAVCARKKRRKGKKGREREGEKGRERERGRKRERERERERWSERIYSGACHSCVWHDSYIGVTWWIYMCARTHSYVWHDTWQFVVRHASLTCEWFIPLYRLFYRALLQKRTIILSILLLTCERVMPHAWIPCSSLEYVCQYSFICVMWHLTTHWFVRFIRLMSRYEICVLMTHSWKWHKSTWQDSVIRINELLGCNNGGGGGIFSWNPPIPLSMEEEAESFHGTLLYH